MNWNWLSSTKAQAEYLSDCGHNVIIVDNDSTYQPLLDWYKVCSYTVISTKGVILNTYNRFVWELNLPDLTQDNYYGVTDSDLDLSLVPKGFKHILLTDIERSPGIIKSGLSLKIDDLPDNPYAIRYKTSEANHFNPDHNGFYDIPIDTTFAIYSKERCNNLHRLWKAEGDSVPNSFLDNRYFYRAHRSPAPYIARHLPWYMDINNLSEEELYHISVAKHGSVLYFKQVYHEELSSLGVTG